VKRQTKTIKAKANSNTDERERCMPGRKLMQTKVARIVSGLFFVVYYGLAISPASAGRAGNDYDGLPQRWERHHGTNPHVDDSGMDLDGDRLSNRAEYKHHTDPSDSDTDDDGASDGDEVKKLKTDPRVSDNDGAQDEAEDDDAEECDDDQGEDADEAGDVDENDDDAEDEADDAEDDDAEEADDSEDENEAEDDDAAECDDDGESDVGDDGEIEHVVGEITSYNSSTGRLTIELNDGKTVTGIVTDGTELDWESLDGSQPDSSASESDLDDGQDITDYEFEDGSENFEEVDLAR
jgi:hypothetical protein